MEPFLLRALVAGLALAVISAPLGCLLVWRRMAFFGETVAHACLIGIALAIAFDLDKTGSALFVAILVAAGLAFLSRQRIVPIDSLMSVLAHSALAFGVIATALAQGTTVDLMAYLFGDIFAVAPDDLVWLAVGGAAVGLVVWRLWGPLLALAVHEELAAAEGVNRDTVKLAFIVVLALIVAIASKVVGILLTVAFLIVPAVTARPMVETPERMAMLAAAIAVVGVLGGLSLSWRLDIPGGPSIVATLAVMAVASLTYAAFHNRQ